MNHSAGIQGTFNTPGSGRTAPVYDHFSALYIQKYWQVIHIAPPMSCV
ncbi:hypothetical protein [uncultured Aliiroseovarius sp.]|nr:hypothetical protein [uncultured Aliiroseovarius sp.]